MAIGILLFDDSTSMRESLKSLLQQSDRLLLLGAYPDVLQAEAQVKEAAPDVILMDIDMPGRNGIDAVKRIRTFNRQVHIIMLTVFEDHAHVLEAIMAGASGYLLKKHISDKLETAIREVQEGGAPMSPGIARMVLQAMQAKAPVEENVYQLTNREKEILQSLSKGNSFKLIAASLSISIDTVRTHMKRIYEKLQVHSQIEAVSKAAIEKLI